MEKTYYADQKVTIWRRTTFSVEAESGAQCDEEAKKICENFGEYDNMENSEVLYDTEENLSVKDNQGQSTRELWTGINQLLTNA